VQVLGTVDWLTGQPQDRDSVLWGTAWPVGTGEEGSRMTYLMRQPGLCVYDRLVCLCVRC